MSNKKIRQKIKTLACGGIFALMQAGTALAADGESSSFTISGTFSKLTSGTSAVIQDGLQYAFDNVSSLAWGALAIGILLIAAKAGLSHLGTDSNPADAAKHENAIVGVVRIAIIAVVGIGIIYMLHQKYA
jgi:hypothetical protein